MESKELLGCPFCGGKADLHQFIRSRYSVDCSDCDAGMIGFVSEEEAIEKWNTRVLKAQPAGVVLPEPMKRGDEGGSGEYGAAMIRGYNACLREVARLNSSPVSAGEYGDAYQGAREDMAIWKRRALEAETKVREQDQIIENLGNALNDENGPTFMGEPVLKARAALSAPSHGEQVREVATCSDCNDSHWRTVIDGDGIPRDEPCPCATAPSAGSQKEQE